MSFPVNATIVFAGFLAGSILVSTVLRWIGTIVSTLHESYEHRWRMVALTSIFNAGPWMLVAACVFAWFVHSKPWAPWFGAGVAIWAAWHGYFAYRMLQILRRKREAQKTAA